MKKKELEFTPQIYTTKHHFEELLEMGLKPKTADMVYHFTGSRVEAIQWELLIKNNYFNKDYLI